MKSKRSPRSQKINKHNWYYEYPAYIELVHEVMQNDSVVRAEIIKIPKRKLIASLKRMGEGDK